MNPVKQVLTETLYENKKFLPLQLVSDNTTYEDSLFSIFYKLSHDYLTVLAPSKQCELDQN